ncbi:MAG: LysR family transcriptional regulator [Muribaculaceae bacterium]|nr:LysR family transcriptional regulator [Muribaculaceae bacterium]
MTLQQLKYIIAVDRHRSFSKAAEACDVTQPTLSGMLVKLEEELDIRIFDRTNKLVTATAIGEQIIRQAEKAVAEAERIAEIVSEAKGCVNGHLALCISPGIAPYIIPQFIRLYLDAYPDVDLSIEEMKAAAMTDALRKGIADIGIATAGHAAAGVYEIPLYTERFMVYLSENCRRRLPMFNPEDLEHENMWIMKESQCLRQSAFSFCKERAKGHSIYEAGNIETLIRIVDENGGYTIIPEMHLPLLTQQQLLNVRDIDGDRLSMRRVSLYIKEEYIRGKMLNSIVDTLKKIIPRHMFEPNILKSDIKL